MVVVCGSVNSWILDNLINNHGGLYNRVTYEIKLMPFTLQECELFFKDKGINLSRYDIVQSYMAVGGIPYYLGYFRRDYSLAQNLDQLFFSPRAKFHDEFNRLFDSVFDRPEIMKTIVRKLYTKRDGFSRSELIDALKISEGETLSKCLNALVTSEFVIKYVPFGCKGNDSHYKLIYPFCLFYLHFAENLSTINEDGYWLQNLETQAVKSWRGLAFEIVCFHHIPQIKNALGISGVATTQSAWTKKPDDTEGMQIDLLLSRRDNIVNLCEMKFYNDVFSVDYEYYRVMMRRENAVSALMKKTAAVHNTLVTTFGLRQNKYSGVFTNVITMEELFRV